MGFRETCGEVWQAAFPSPSSNSSGEVGAAVVGVEGLTATPPLPPRYPRIPLNPAVECPVDCEGPDSPRRLCGDEIRLLNGGCHDFPEQ